MADQKWVLTFTPNQSSPGTLLEQELSLEELAELFGTATEGDKEGPGFIPATFLKPYRKAENVSAITMFVVDADHLTARPKPASPYAHFWYETHTAGNYRLIFPIKIPYLISNPRQWQKHAWPRLIHALGFEKTAAADAQCKDPCRFYNLPRRPKDSTRESGIEDGELLDIEAVVGPYVPVKVEKSAAPPSPSVLDLSEIRNNLSGRQSAKNAQIYDAVIKGASLVPPPPNGVWPAGALTRRQAWMELLAAISLLVPDGTPVEACWPLFQDSFESMCADDPEGFDPGERREQINQMLQSALDDAAETRASIQAERRAEVEWVKSMQGKLRQIVEPAVEVSGDHDDSWKSLLIYHRDSKGNETSVPECVGHNVSLILRHDPNWKGVLRYEDFLMQPEIVGGPACKNDAGLLKEAHFCRAVDWFYSSAWNMKVSDMLVKSRMLMVASENHVDPLRNYLLGLEWDGVPRIREAFANYFTAVPSPALPSFSEKFFIGAAARALHPGCQLDTMIVLEGRMEGEGKTSALRMLANNGQFFCGASAVVKDKDSLARIAKYWIYEMAELVTYKRTDSESMKDFVSRREEVFRPPYAAADVCCPRRSVIVATTNHTDWSHEVGRQRRQWPVECKKVDLEALDRDKGQLWAEAVFKCEQGLINKTPYLWHLTPEETDLAYPEILERREEDPIADRIRLALLMKAPEERSHVYLADLISAAGMEAKDPWVANRIGRAVRRLDGEHKRESNGARLYYYDFPKLKDFPRIKSENDLKKLFLTEVKGGKQ